MKIHIRYTTVYRTLCGARVDRWTDRTADLGITTPTVITCPDCLRLHAARDGTSVPPGATKEALRAAYTAGHVRGSGYDGELPQEMIDGDFEEWINRA